VAAGTSVHGVLIPPVAMSIRSGAASGPPDTFSHSTRTVPLKAASLAGRRTSSRVAYGAVSSGRTVHCPSGVRSPVSWWLVAEPLHEFLLDVTEFAEVVRSGRSGL